MAVAEGAQAIAEVFNVGLLGLIHQHIARVCLGGIIAYLRDKTGLRHIEVAATLVDFLARFVGGEWRPLRDDIEVGRYLQQHIEHEGPCFGDGLFHRQHTHNVIADPQMVAFGFDVGVDHLIVEKLRGLRPARNPPIVVIQQPAKERELSLLMQDLDLHEIRKLPSEYLHALVEPSKIVLDMTTQQRLHAVIGELHL